MELNAGFCTICSSNNEVVKPEDSSIYWELITEIFKEDIPNLNDYQNNVKICPTCVYKITLIDSKKAILSNEIKEALSNSNNCHLCNSHEHTKVFKVGHSRVLKEFEPYKKLQESGSGICAECYFVMESSNNLKIALKKLSKSRNAKRRSVENGEKQSENAVEKSPKMETETPPIVTPKEEEHEEKENESIRTPMRTLRRIQKNGQKPLDTPDKSSPTTKLRTRTKKPELEVVTVKVEDSDKPEVRVKTLRDKKSTTPNGDLKNSTPRKNVKPTGTVRSKLETAGVKLKKSDLSKLSSLTPVCAMKLKFNEKIKADNKFFKLVPYIMLSNSDAGLKKRKGRQNNGASITKTTKGPKETKTAATRTPPIKIKLKKGKVNIKPNVSVKNKKIKGSSDTVEKRKMVVKVARLNLSKSGSDKSDDEEEPIENVNIIDNVLIEKEDLNSSMDLSTPKKKKKVHFNDTPTIIITGDDISDQEEKSDKIDTLEDEQEEEEMEDITNVLEESDFQEIESNQTKTDAIETQDDKVDKDTDLTENKTVEESKEVIETQLIDNNEPTSEKEEIFEINDVEEDPPNQEIVNVEEDSPNQEIVNVEEDSPNQEIVNVEEDSPNQEIVNVEEDSPNQEIVNVDKEKASESPKQLSDEETRLDENTPTDQNNVDKDSALIDLDIVDECSTEEEAEKTDFTIDTGSTLDKIIDTDANEDNDVIINNEMLSHAADDKENFGSLIDEVQKCLTSSEDFTSLSKKQEAESPTVEILDDDSLTCLQDLDVLKVTFTEDLIQDNDVAEKQPLGSKRGAGSTGSEISPKKSRLN